MATVGEQIKEPEIGWRRYDDTHRGIKYTGSWYTATGANYYNGSVNVTTKATDNNYVSFTFYGSKIRIISDFATDRHTNNSITIDGVTQSFSAYKNGPSVLNAIVYEKTDLTIGYHTVTITVGKDKINFILDAIDIDETGYLYGYALTSPEAGWKRLDDSSSQVITIGNIARNTTDTNFHNTTAIFIQDSTGEIKFKFYGTKFRLIGAKNTNRSTNIEVFIDDVKDTSFSQNGTLLYKSMDYEKSGLSLDNHLITIKGNGVYGLDAIDIDDTGYLVTQVGQRLTTPDMGWKRYDDSHPALKWGGAVTYVSNSNTDYNSTLHYWTGSSTVGASLELHFVGTKFRLLAGMTPTQTTEVRVFIDGNLETYNPYNATDIRQMLVYEKTGLSNTKHIVRLESIIAGNWGIDAIDINSDGRLLHPDEVTNIDELVVGKRIRCNYQATVANTTGWFTGLGKENANFIPATGSLSTSNGDFYLIMVEDYNKKLKLISDRNIQNLISWDTLNNNGYVNGVKTFFNLIPQMTSDNHALGSAFASSVYTGEYVYSAWKVFDRDKKTGVYTSRWSTTGTTGFIGFNFTEETLVNGYSLMTLNSGSSNWITSMPKDWKFEGSEDTTDGKNGTWITLDTQTSQTNWLNLTYNRYTFKNNKKYKAYRLNFSSNNGDTGYSGLYEMEMYNTNLDVNVRLMSGGVSSTDKDNEWDKYIVNSTLNDTITAGDNNVWNYNGGSSWTSTVNIAGSANRTGRGANGNVGASGYNPTNYVAVATATGFRPLIEINILPIFKSLIFHNGIYKTLNLNNWEVVSTNLPSNDTFIEEGLEDLFVLDRKQTELKQHMDNTQTLGSGKIFKSNVNLKKYPDIINFFTK